MDFKPHNLIAFFPVWRKTLGMKCSQPKHTTTNVPATAAGSTVGLPTGLQQLSAQGLDLGACSRREGADLILCVKVHPRGRKFKLGRVVGGYLQVHVAAAPENGKATDELLYSLAKLFGVRQAAVSVMQGAFTPRKVIRIAGVS